MHAHAAALRDNDPALAASMMITNERTADLAMLADDNTSGPRPQSGATEEAIPRSTVTDGSREISQGDVMITVINAT